MPTGSMILLLLLFDMANRTGILVSEFLNRKVVDCVVHVFVDFVCAVESDVCKFFIKNFYFFYVNNCNW